MIPEPVRHVRLPASRDVQPKTKGWVDYKEGWFEIKRTEATGRIDALRHADPLPQARGGVSAYSGSVKSKYHSLAQDSTSGKLPCVSKTCQRAGPWTPKVPEGERYCKEDFTFQDIVAFFVASAFRPVWPGRCI